MPPALEFIAKPKAASKPAVAKRKPKQKSSTDPNSTPAQLDESTEMHSYIAEFADATAVHENIYQDKLKKNSDMHGQGLMQPPAPPKPRALPQLMVLGGFEPCRKTPPPVQPEEIKIESDSEFSELDLEHELADGRKCSSVCAQSATLVELPVVLHFHTGRRGSAPFK